jgi:hypothetical protein
MSNREDKDKRRQERLAAEQAAKKQADQRKRLGIVGGVVLVVAVAAVVLFAVVLPGDDGPEKGGNGTVTAPTQGTTNLAEAVRAAGCKMSEELPDEGSGHVTTSMAGKYKTNPPTSGDHDPTPAEDGIYTAGNPPDLEQSVHALEHGRIEIQYKEGTPKETIERLEAVGSEEVKGDAGYHQLVFQNLTDMEPAVAAVAWRYSMTCPAVNDKIYDAIRAFRTDQLDKGPEFVP